jgi:hypothetical protein
MLMRLAAGAALPEVQTIALPPLAPDTRLAVWGDSITESTLSSLYIETYILACAGRKDIKVCTFGHSGETLAGPISRQSDFDFFKPTAATINYGMNDTQYSPYTAAKGTQFDRDMHGVLAVLQRKGVKQIVIVGPGLVDDTFTRAGFFGNEEPAGRSVIEEQNKTLEHFRDIARADAVAAHCGYADIHNRMLDSYTLAKQALGPGYDFAREGGGIHPAANGQLMMACEILRALGFDGQVGTIRVDMKGSATATAGHRIIGFDHGAVVVESSKYPFCCNYDPFTSNAPDSMASILPFLPFGKDLNRFILKVSDLDAPSAAVTWGDQTRTFTRQQLADGVNLAAAFSQTPFDATFARVIDAVSNKQAFENFTIKGTSNYFGNDNGGNIDDNMIAEQARKDAEVKAMIVPIRHTIVITPAGADNSASPIIAGSSVAYGTVGAPLSYKIYTIHPASHFTASDLPAGLAIDATTGQISGRPTDAGTSQVKLTATNASGNGAADLTIVIDPPTVQPPAITSPATASGKAGEPFTYQITATNSPALFFATSPSDKGTEPPASSLPAGISYNEKTGVVSGTPKVAGTYTIQMAAMNREGVGSLLVKVKIAQ